MSTQTDAPITQLHHAPVSASPSNETQLAEALRHLLTQQGYPIDNIRLQDVISKHQNTDGSAVLSPEQLFDVLQEIGVSDTPEILTKPDAAVLPLLAYHQDKGWGVIDSQTPQGLWHFRQIDVHHNISTASCSLLLRIRLQHTPSSQKRRSFADLLKTDLKSYKGILFEAVIATFLINVLA